jgi:hypothetical protein
MAVAVAGENVLHFQRGCTKPRRLRKRIARALRYD